MEFIPKENVYQIYKDDHPDSETKPFLKLPSQPDSPPLFVTTKKQLPLVAHVFLGGISLVGLYIVYRLLEKSSRDKKYFPKF